jgi:uncharacterized protein HemX
MKWWGWLLAGLAVGAGALVVVWYYVQGRRSDALKASVDMMVEWHKRDVEAKRERLGELLDDFRGNEAEIKKITGELDEKKRRLEESYADKGLTADEISARFNRISL